MATLLYCALVAGCGDDGSERLSSCPDARIETDKMGIIRCARPRAGTGGGAAAKPGGTAGKPAMTNQANRASSPEQAGAVPAKAAATGGSNASPNDGAAPVPAASSGSSATPPGGATPAELPSGGNWYCLQVMNACSCVMGAIDSDTCDKPRPTCCVSVKNESSVATCVCYPENSAECAGVKQDPASYPPVKDCPPS